MKRKKSKGQGKNNLLRFSFDNPLIVGGGLLLMVGISVLVLTPSGYGERQILTVEDVGTVARKDIPAPKDFTYREVDPGATERKREEASSQVLPVYDYHLENRNQVADRIRTAFGMMRRIRQTHEETTKILEQPGDKDLDDRAEVAEEAGEGDRQKDGVAEPRSWEQELQNNKLEFYRTLGEVLDEPEFGVFFASQFSHEMEDRLVYLVSSVMQQKIVDNYRQLELQGNRGVTLRIMRGNISIDEIVVRNLNDFLGPRDAAERLADQARQGLKGLDLRTRDMLVQVAGRLITDNCSLNQAETQSRRERARLNVKELVTTTEFKQGQIIVGRGHLVTHKHVQILASVDDGPKRADFVQVTLGIALFMVILGAVLFSFAKDNVRKFKPDRKDVVLIVTWMVTMLAIIKISATMASAVAEKWESIPLGAFYYALPVAAGAMLIRMVLNSESALLFSMVFAILCGLMLNNSLFFASYTFVVGVVAAGGVRAAQERTELINAGVRTGVIAMGVALANTLLGDGGLTVVVLFNLTFAFIGGLLSGFVVTALVPIVETIFNYTTNIKLLELANLNGPLLKDLAIRAPGTFHHSILVGSLVEGAAVLIRANPLLARVGAYYHDLGKGKAPGYFAENQRSGDNPHDRLRPSMSALILRDHVKDGVKLLKASKLPQPIIDICEQHVGTTLIGFFYERAKKLAEEAGEPVPDESDFRYPGPKPQTREAALVLLADSVEAAAKSMSDPTPAKLQGMVQRIINAKFIDGQLDESDLTLKDLHEIAKSFSRVLAGIYHHRPEYPHQREASAKGESKSSSGQSSAAASSGSGSWSGSKSGKQEGKNGDRNQDQSEGKGEGKNRPEHTKETSPEGIKRLGLS